jgi:hypothetical protein
MNLNLPLADKAATALIGTIKRVVLDVIEGDRMVVAYDLGDGETAYRLESRHEVDELRKQAAKDKLSAMAAERKLPPVPCERCGGINSHTPRCRTHPAPLTRGEGPAFA